MVSKVLCSSLIMVTYYFPPGNATWFLKLYGSLKASSIVSSLTSSLVSNETCLWFHKRYALWYPRSYALWILWSDMWFLWRLFGSHDSMLCIFLKHAV